VEGCSLHSVIRPGERREKSLCNEEHNLFGGLESDLPPGAPNLHNRIDEEVCRIAWVNEASTDTCAFDLSLRKRNRKYDATNDRSQVCLHSFFFSFQSGFSFRGEVGVEGRSACGV
jgi:hypothetical protein